MARLMGRAARSPRRPTPRRPMPRAGPSARSHPEHAETRLWNRRMEGRLDAHGEHAARVERIDDAVVPEAGRREVSRAFAFVGLEDGPLEGVAFFVRDESAADGRQDSR